MDAITQKMRIIEYCEKHGSITVREAFTKLNINSPTKRISEIKNSGLYTVKSIIESKTGKDGHRIRWKRYFIKKKNGGGTA